MLFQARFVRCHHEYTVQRKTNFIQGFGNGHAKAHPCMKMAHSETTIYPIRAGKGISTNYSCHYSNACSHATTLCFLSTDFRLKVLNFFFYRLKYFRSN